MNKLIESALNKPWSLSRAQEGIWLGHQLNTESALYNAAELVEIQGDLSRELLIRAINEVYDSAEALNVRFTECEEELTQALHRMRRYPLPLTYD